MAASVWIKLVSATPLSGSTTSSRPSALNDAGGNRVVEAKGIADRDYELPDFELFPLRELGLREIVPFDVNHRQIGVGIRAYESPPKLPSIGQCDVDRIRPFDYVMVGEDIARGNRR